MKLIIGLIVAGALAGLAAPADAAGVIRVSAAASMKAAVTELAATYMKRHPQVSITLNTGGSGALAKQIEQGAPADIFISASREWTDYLAKKKAVRRVENLAGNALVFVCRPGVKATGMKDLPALQRVAIGSPKSVPAGEYAAEAMAKTGIAAAMTNKVMMARDVTEALMYVERGEVDGAFVYRTDALTARKVVTAFTVPAALHAMITYPAALTASGGRNPEAEKFMNFLTSAEAAGIMKKAGFSPATPEKNRL